MSETVRVEHVGSLVRPAWLEGATLRNVPVGTIVSPSMSTRQEWEGTGRAPSKLRARSMASRFPRSDC